MPHRRHRARRPSAPVNSPARSPANTRWVWLSTKPGSTQRPAASIRPSAAGARPVPTAHDAVVLEHDGGVAHDPERPLAQRGVAR